MQLTPPVPTCNDAGTVLDALDEDRRTTWIPDPLGDADLSDLAFALRAEHEHVGEAGRLTDSFLPVPRPGRAPLATRNLPLEDLIRLYWACEPLRLATDKTLNPGVCGYRRGAVPGRDYVKSFLAFEQAVTSRSPHQIVVEADVESCFANITLSTAAQAVSGLGASSLGVLDWLRNVEDAGLQSLPPGYADARLIANLVLHEAEQHLPADFVRWVDDYRLFPTGDPEAAIGALSAGLASVGLRLNPSKLRIRTAGEPEAAMTSVYQAAARPGSEGLGAVRRMWAFAAADPVGRRRELRFALPRLAEAGDDRAVDIALRTLTRELAWDAPRGASYLARFLDDPTVQAGVEAAAVQALLSGSLWLTGRALPLLANLGTVSAPTLDVLSEHLDALPGTIWGLAGRVLALHGSTGAKRHLARSVSRAGVPDARSALAIRADLSLGIDSPAAEQRPETGAWLVAHGRAPLPSLASSL